MRLLFLTHSHPELQAGGTEIFARDLFRAHRESGHTGTFVAGATPRQRSASPGTAFQVVGEYSDEVLVRTGGFDQFFLSQTDLYGFSRSFAQLLDEEQPEIVHIHHLLNLGVEILSLIRRHAPSAKIVMTLHDYYPICANEGQLLTTSGVLCSRAQPDHCLKCFSDRTLTEFKLRELHIRRAFDQVDHFIAPSKFLKQKFVEWGLADGIISVIPNGLPCAEAASVRSSQRRDRFAFFGHINGFKGATTVVEASSILSDQNCSHQLSVFGGSEFQSEQVKVKFAEACESAPDSTYHGPYRRSEFKRLIEWADWVVFPSLWWENAPLVISEALQHQRPVICSNVGGSVELIQDGVNGLHFRLGDACALADIMKRGIEERGLWQRLVEGIKETRTIQASAQAYQDVYINMINVAVPRAVA